LTYFEAEEKIVNIRVFRTYVKNEDDYQYRRFKQEVKRLVALQDPNISRVFDCGLLEEGLPYVVLEHIEGPSLEEILVSQNRLAGDQVGLVFSQLAKAVHVAYEQGILHEGLKPSRVIICEDEEGDVKVRLTGLGLMALHNKLGMSLKTPQLRARCIGTAAYLSPEQCCEGFDIDGRTDIYALGCMMYESLCGQAPFLGSPEEIMRKHTEENSTPIPEVRKDLQFPRRLLAITNKCIQKDPVRRYQYVRDLQSDLEKDVDPTERDKATVIPQAIQKAQKTVKENKEGGLKLVGMIVLALAGLIGALYGGSYIVTTTGQAASHAVWQGKLDAARKAVTENKMSEARDGFLDAISEAKKFPPPDLRLAHSKNELAALYLLLGSFSDARTQTNDAITIETAMKNNDPEAGAKSYEVRSMAQLALGKTKDAEKDANKAYDLAQKISGEKTERLYGAASAQFKVALAENNFAEAKKAIDKMKDAIGKTNTILSMELISGEKQAEALLKQANKDYDGAEKGLQDVLGTRQEKIGLASLASIDTMEALGRLYAAEGKYDKAIKMLDAAYSAKSGLIGEKNPAMVNLLFTIAQAYDKSKKPAEYEKFLRKTYEIGEETFGKNSTEMLPYIDALAKFLRANKQISAAEVYEVEALDIRHPERVSKLGK
jgi:lipopolysaccharide biosynthesis regulator YciM